jgi:hypothetical protein
MRTVLLATLAASLFACNDTTVRHGMGGNGGAGGSGGSGIGGNGNGNGGTGGSGGTGSNCTPTATSDSDGDGYTMAQGDCNDCDPNINPGAVDVVGDPTDYDCDGKVDDHSICDSGLVGKKDATSLANAIDICDPRFLKSATITGPADMRARNILEKFGTKLVAHHGANMSFISSGVAVDTTGTGYVDPQDGTNLANSNKYQNPLPNLAGVSNCGFADNSTVYDYTEITLTMHAPTNANSFSFDFQFFSGEYPIYVCQSYNDQFLAVVQSSKTYPTATNISFDMAKHPISVNSGFFTVCENYITPQTMNCTTPPSANAGTGYDVAGGGINGSVSPIPAGSTGWLTTTAPITPSEDFTLRFVIFDEGDHVLDSAALIDNFRWGTTKVMGPVTGPITYRVVKHRASSSSLMCGA